MFCRKCGAPNRDDADFCEKCGVKIILYKDQFPKINNEIKTFKTAISPTISDVENSDKKTSSNKDNRKFNKRKLVISLISLFLIICIGLTGYTFITPIFSDEINAETLPVIYTKGKNTIVKNSNGDELLKLNSSQAKTLVISQNGKKALYRENDTLYSVSLKKKAKKEMAIKPLLVA